MTEQALKEKIIKIIDDRLEELNTNLIFLRNQTSGDKKELNLENEKDRYIFEYMNNICNERAKVVELAIKVLSIK